MKSFIKINKAGSLIHSFLFTADNLHAVLTDAATVALPFNQRGKTRKNTIKTQFDWLSSAVGNVRLNL